MTGTQDSKPSITGTPRKTKSTGTSPADERDALNLRDLVAVVRRNWWIVLLSSAALGGAAAFVASRIPPTYRARGVIRLANTRQAMAGSLTNDNSQSAVGTYSDPLRSQIEILTSRTIASGVVDSEPGILRIATVGVPRNQLRSVRIDPRSTVDSVQLAFTTTGVTARSATASVQSPYQVPLDIEGLSFVIGSPPQVPEATLRVTSRDAATSALVSSIKATQRPESDIIDVDLVAGERTEATTLVNRLLTVFAAASAESAHQRSRQRLDFIQQQLAHNDSIEAAAQSALSDFRVREHMFSGKEKFADGQRDAVALDIQRGSLASDRDVARGMVSGLASASGPERARIFRTLLSIQGVSGNPVVSQAYDRLVRLRISRDSMTTGRFASAASNPDVQRLDELIAASESQVTDAVQSYISSLTAKIDVLDQARARSSAAMDRLPGAAAEELRLSTQVESIHKVGDQLREELQKAAIAAAVEGGEVEIVDLATSALPLATATLPKILIGLLVGLVLGIGAAFTREHLDTTIKRREDVERVLQITSVGVIPSINNEYVRRKAAEREKAASSGATGRKGRPAKADRTLSRSEQKEAIRASLGIEAFASLRTHMLYLPDGGDLKTVVVTSCAPKDGKSTVSANIAEAYARSGARVMLIDCDLRRPRLHEVFGEVVEVGLSEVLKGTLSLEAAMRPVAGSKSMSLLTAGSRVSNPSEMIDSPEMRALVKSLQTKFDLIILDSPPVLVVSDAAVLANSADGVLFVVRAGTTEPLAARAAVAKLESVGANIIGAVLNDPDDTLTRYDSDYYYTYYNSYFEAAS